MAMNAKTIKKRIKSVKNTQKMTKAMEMVSAAKMRKSTAAALLAREYSTRAADVMMRLSDLDDPQYELLQLRSVHNVLIILISSNRGLCGSYNANVFSEVTKVINKGDSIFEHRVPEGRDDVPTPAPDAHIHILGIGKKSALYAKKHGYAVPAVFDDMSEKPKFRDVAPIADMATEGYIKGDYDKVVVAYAHFVSPLKQDIKIRQLLPLSARDIRKMTDVEEYDDTNALFPVDTYHFEPSREAIIREVLPDLVRTQLYQGVLEASASEHSARMIAMKNASENAAEMVKELTLTYNKARQAAITQEISEIVGGAAALE